MAARKAGSPAKKKTTTISAPGKAPVTITKGGLHKSVGVPQGQKIPAAKVNAAANGAYGPKAQKQAVMAKGMLKAGQKTAAKNRSKKKGK